MIRVRLPNGQCLSYLSAGYVRFHDTPNEWSLWTAKPECGTGGK